MTIRITHEAEDAPAPPPRPLSPGAEKLREHLRAIYATPSPWHLPARAE